MQNDLSYSPMFRIDYKCTLLFHHSITSLLITLQKHVTCRQPLLRSKVFTIRNSSMRCATKYNLNRHFAFYWDTCWRVPLDYRLRSHATTILEIARLAVQIMMVQVGDSRSYRTKSTHKTGRTDVLFRCSVIQYCGTHEIRDSIVLVFSS